MREREREVNIRYYYIYILQSDDMTLVFTSIEEAVDNNKLCVRKDKAVHADIGDV